MSLRGFLMWFMPSRMKAAAEADSRKWIATCLRCGTQTSIWDLGGIRYKAIGTQLNGFRCKACGKWSWHKVQWLPDSPAAKTG